VIVLDASVAVKWYVPEDQSADARLVFTENESAIVVPEIFRGEVVGAMVRRANMNKAERAASEESIRIFMGLIAEGFIDLTNLTPDQMTRAAGTAIDLGHPLKDCLYLALAMDLGCPLITCDAKFAAKAHGIYDGVRVLGE
jgi:predicted nucleic acid-binding protein